MQVYACLICLMCLFCTALLAACKSLLITVNEFKRLNRNDDTDKGLSIIFIGRNSSNHLCFLITSTKKQRNRMDGNLRKQIFRKTVTLKEENTVLQGKKQTLFIFLNKYS